VTSAGVLVEVVGHVVIEFKALQKALVGTKKYSFMEHGRLGGQPGRGLLRIYLLNGDYIAACNPAHVGPEAFQLATSGKPRQFRNGVVISIPAEVSRWPNFTELLTLVFGPRP